ncbi:MAG: hypothetical protein ACM3UZ_10490 [Acidobacteriota bacterium]
MPEDQQNDKQQEITIPNPYEIWKKMYFATEDAAAASVRESIKTKGFAQSLDSMLEAYLLNHKMMSDANQKLLDQSPFPSKADVARVAELVIGLEDKIDGLETGFVMQLSRVLQFLAIMSESMTKSDNQVLSEQITKMGQSIEQLSKKNDLSKRVDALEKAVGGVEKTLDQINQSLTVLVKQISEAAASKQ